MANKQYVEQSKEECQTSSRALLYKGLELGTEKLDKIFDYIISLGYVDKVDYQYIYNSIKQLAASCDADLNAPYDWEEMDAPESTANEKTPRQKSH